MHIQDKDGSVLNAFLCMLVAFAGFHQHSSEDLSENSRRCF